MKIDHNLTDQTLLSEIGRRLAMLRLQKDVMQTEVAKQAGVGVRTVQRLENGQVATQLSAFLRVCRALGILDRFESLIPETAASPLDELKRRGRQRRRSSGRSAGKTKTGKWLWKEKT
ncbi:MAG: helix-turn-helix transcriptional regulator [Verrucomicrobiae bacterium]|nr:helix-turn-helix transcriptional regulator [Verrucomicrobiae bacterium]